MVWSCRCSGQWVADATGANPMRYRSIIVQVVLLLTLHPALLPQSTSGAPSTHEDPVTVASVRDLLQTTPSDRRSVVIRGAVTSAPGTFGPPQSFIVQDTSGAALLVVQKQSPASVKLWQEVEVEGTPEWTPLRPREPNIDENHGFVTLAAKRITPLQSARSVEARAVTRADVKRGLYLLEHVRVQGTVMRVKIGEVGPGEEDTLDFVIIGPDPEIWAALRRHRSDRSWVQERAKPGSEVELSGVLTFSQAGQDFRIRLRTPTDVAIVRESSWFTLGHILMLAAIVGLVVASCLAWILLLKRTIRKRTAEIQEREQQLQQAQKMEVLNQLAGGIAHDFNNILMAMTGYAELLLDEDIDERHKKSIAEIMKAGQRGARLTRQLLTFSRKHPIAPTLMDMNELVSELEPMLSRLVGKDIQVELTLSEKPPVVRADRSQMEQVLINLAANARDAMPTGGTLSISTAVVTVVSKNSGLDAGAYVRVIVADTGYGMDARTMSRIFDPFFTTKDIGKGTGLGLSTVHGIVRQNDGDIKVDSAVGRGTTFTIYLPYRNEPPDRANRDEDKTVWGQASGRILVIEDEDQIRESMCNYLSKLGYHVEWATDAADGLRVAARKAFDVLVTDVVMPGMSGVELFSLLSASQTRLKVVFISGHAERVVDYGVTELRGPLLKKPFQLADLANTIRQVLTDNRGPLRSGAPVATAGPLVDNRA